ncbi:formyltetrahydrofolate-dependent phosphoribosylglycinamide formyltransferase [Roseimicrobium gellanilyticum]|uniref:Phosphoribosylglycinamide formyltransferase n=1 Tax=Roseimicrobium gellanilyticum TaxID=748857 RepID=A0A366HPW4_9BACT|nr:phosphoribosylglycinamide formyltransferase [Roseimicrobium gellanilyticum]RBP45391.1 formyltetrahydrofolate-dependent phosphoribosylglycinamide formyltransferase [Roseimicrobium gellanilyticum]
MSQDSWITTAEAVRDFRDQLDAEGRKLVFTNGCFDLLHAGHVRYLRQARALGDGLVVALNSDASVRALKGEARPINHQEDRAEILMALQSVNGVVIFDDPRVTKLIEIIRPHVYAKGGDYTLETLDAGEREALIKAGSTICLLPLVPGRSTTNTIGRMRAGEDAPVPAPPKNTPPVAAAADDAPVPVSVPLPAAASVPAPELEPTAPEPAAAAVAVLQEPGKVVTQSIPLPLSEIRKTNTQSIPPVEPRKPATVTQGIPRVITTTIAPREETLSIQSRATGAVPLSPRVLPLRIGVLGSGQGTNFEAIQRAIDDGRLNAEIAVVISDVEGSRLLAKARESGLSRVFVDPGPNARVLPIEAQEEIYEQLKAHEVQVVVLTGFMRVIKDPLLSGYKDRIVNIHPSLLPKFKGKAAWVQALEEGEVETGCTVHLVNAEVDGGRVLAQAKVPIHIGDTADDVFYRIQAEEHLLLPEVLNNWRESGLPVG